MRIDGFVILHLRLLGVIGCMVWWHASAVAEVKVSPLVVPKQGKTGYQRLSVKETGLYPKGKYVGIKNEFVRDTGNSGLAAGDINGDGLVDLFVCGMEKANALYLNRGNWKFEDITENAGVACRGWRLSGALFSDTDADGDLDLILTSLRDGRDFLFINDGHGKFSENLETQWVFSPRGGSVGAATADVDGDGSSEIIVPNGGGHLEESLEGLYVLGPAEGSWLMSRQIWNQHAYAIVHVNDDPPLLLVRHDVPEVLEELAPYGGGVVPPLTRQRSDLVRQHDPLKVVPKEVHHGAMNVT